MLYRIGGPGKLDAHLGSAAIVEFVDANKWADVLPIARNGDAIKRRFETVKLAGFQYLKAVIDLREKELHIKELPFMTRDGLPIKVIDVIVRYRLSREPEAQKQDFDRIPFPFADPAIFSLVYQRPNIRQYSYNKDQVLERNSDNTHQNNLDAQWEMMVKNRLKIYFSRHLRHYTLDEILQLDGNNEIRDKMAQQFFQRADIFGDFQSFGTELIWVGVGAIKSDLDAKLDIDKAQIERWQKQTLADKKKQKQFIANESSQAYTNEIVRILKQLLKWFQVNVIGKPPMAESIKTLNKEFARQMRSLKEKLGSSASPEFVALVTALEKKYGPLDPPPPVIIGGQNPKDPKPGKPT